jgi:hypothetical protein
MGPTATAPFYADWTFWSFAIACVAVVLSQLPHVKLWFKGPALDLDVHAVAHVTHHLGHANVRLFVSMTNTGAANLRVKGATLMLSRDGSAFPELSAMGVLNRPNDTNAEMFTSFNLRPDEHWAHTVQFYEQLPRPADNHLRKLKTDLKANILAARAVRARVDPQDQSVMLGAPEAVVPVMEHFARTFSIEQGEYKVDLRINTSPPLPAAVKSYRFTLYESDAAVLRSYSNDYLVGGGVFYDVPHHEWLRVQMAPLA